VTARAGSGPRKTSMAAKDKVLPILDRQMAAMRAAA
jgi:hypothetical protein